MILFQLVAGGAARRPDGMFLYSYSFRPLAALTWIKVCSFAACPMNYFSSCQNLHVHPHPSRRGRFGSVAANCATASASSDRSRRTWSLWLRILDRVSPASV